MKPSFQVKIRWLEAEDEKTKQWVSEKVPVAVGKFQVGELQKIINIPSFSDIIDCRKGSKKDTFSVYIREGQIWALFKNWDQFSPDRQQIHAHEFEIVEIISEHFEGSEIVVAVLRKVEGFVSVFCRISTGGGSDRLQIPPHELLN